MPKKNGREIYNEAARLMPAIKAIFTSGYNEGIIHREGVLEKGLIFVPKPYMPSQFFRKDKRGAGYERADKLREGGTGIGIFPSRAA